MNHANTPSRGTDGPLYERFPWGELLSGSIQQLRTLGVAVDLALAKPRRGGDRWADLTDPRGLAAQVRPDELDPSRLLCRIFYPDLPELEAFAPVAFAPGVTLTLEDGHDEYQGDGAALVAAGIVDAQHLPGAPGVGRSRVVLLADGSVARGGRRPRFGHDDGVRIVSPSGRGRFIVKLLLGPDAARDRRELLERQQRAWERACEQLPKPAPLAPVRLRLVHVAADAAAEAEPAPVTMARPRPALVLVAAGA